LNIFGTASAISLTQGKELHKNSENKMLKKDALAIIKRMKKDLKNYNRYCAKVQKTKN